MDKPTCKTCAYWVLNFTDKIDEFGAGSGEPMGYGFCRRFPPTVSRNLLHSEGDLDNYDNLVTEESYWCGEHPNFPEYIRSLKVV